MSDLPIVHEACRIALMKPEKYRDGLRCQFCINHNLRPHPEPEKGKRSFPLKIRLQDGQVKAVCNTCGEIPNFLELIGLKSPDVEPLSECLPKPLGSDSSHSTPAGVDSLISAVKTAEYEPPRVEPVEPEIATGREPGSDDEPTATPASRFVWVKDFCALPPTETWLIKNYLEPDSLSVLFGDSESYKSFLAIDIACHIATGKDWRGNPVKKGVCLFIAGEGGNGLKKRIRAWFEYYKLPMTNIAISIVPLALCDPKNSVELIADIKTFLQQSQFMPSFIALDTLNTHFGPGDENGTSDMTKFLSGMRELRLATKAHVMATHHCGHGDKSRSRGSIVLHNGIDWEYRAERKPDTRITTIFNTKSKDADKPDPLSWCLERQSLPWATEDGEPMASCVLLPADLQDEEPKAGSGNGIALTALRNALMDHGQESAGVVSVSEDQWRQAAYDLGISKSSQDAKMKAFQRAKDALVKENKVSKHDGRFWIPATRSNRT